MNKFDVEDKWNINDTMAFVAAYTATGLIALAVIVLDVLHNYNLLP